MITEDNTKNLSPKPKLPKLKKELKPIKTIAVLFNKRSLILILPTTSLLFLIFFFSFRSSFLKKPSPNILSRYLQNTPSPKKEEVKISARVGGPYFLTKLSGWTSPFAEVTFESKGMATKKTLANETGFFLFESISLPEKPQEICLISQDVNQLTSFPLCLPSPPNNQNFEIEGILLSPTLSLENEEIIKGKTAKASGMTFPNSQIDIYFFIEQKNFIPTTISQIAKGLNFFSPQTAKAADFPVYQIKSNANGYFEFSLPTANLSKNRLFVSAVFPASLLPNQTPLKETRSPKSNTLFFQVIGLWEILKIFFLQLWLSLTKLNWKSPLFIILLEIIILFILLISIKKYRKASKYNINTSKTKTKDQ